MAKHSAPFHARSLGDVIESELAVSCRLHPVCHGGKNAFTIVANDDIPACGDCFDPLCLCSESDTWHSEEKCLLLNAS